MIRLVGVTAGYGETPVLRNVSLTIGRGERVAVVGPNGVGKSSLLRVISGELSPRSGTVFLEDVPLSSVPARTRARRMSAVPQDIPPDIPFTAAEFVMLGRTASLSRFCGPSAEDLRAVDEAMRETETDSLAQRRMACLSGGERQRLALAMALAGEPELLLLDEPTSHLDLKHQTGLMQVLLRRNRERKMTVVAVVHDLTLAGRFFPRLVLMKDSHVSADGSPSDVLREDRISAAYGCPVRIVPLPEEKTFCVLTR